MIVGRLRSDRGSPCNAVEVMLRSGRGASDTRAVELPRPEPVRQRRPDDPDLFSERIEVSMLHVGRRLQNVLTVLSPYRQSEGELHTAYVEAHDALGDLAATYTWVTL